MYLYLASRSLIKHVMYGVKAESYTLWDTISEKKLNSVTGNLFHADSKVNESEY